VTRRPLIEETLTQSIICVQRLDMIVDGRVVVETKSTYDLHPAAQRQLYNYLRATNLEVGLLFHFGREQRFIASFIAKRYTPPGATGDPLARSSTVRHATAGWCSRRLADPVTGW